MKLAHTLLQSKKGAKLWYHSTSKVVVGMHGIRTYRYRYGSTGWDDDAEEYDRVRKKSAVL